MSVHDYEVRGYTRDGALDFHTWHIGEHSRDMELSVAKERRARGELGRIEVRDVRPFVGEGWKAE